MVEGDHILPPHNFSERLGSEPGHGCLDAPRRDAGAGGGPRLRSNVVIKRDVTSRMRL